MAQEWQTCLRHWLAICSIRYALACGFSDLPDFDCALRKLVFQRSSELLGSEANLDAVADALRLTECAWENPDVSTSSQFHASTQCMLADAAPVQVWVSSSGNDTAGNGSTTAPFATLARARDAIRKLRAGSHAIRADIVIRAGLYAMTSALQLNNVDSNLRIVACPDEHVVLSGAVHFPRLKFRRRSARSTVFVAQLPESFKGVDQVFVGTSGSTDVGSRLVWAREPNGNAEFDLQPQGYSLADGNPLGDKAPVPGAGPYKSLWAAEPRRNNTWFPVYGKDHDPRVRDGYVWLHSGANAALYKDDRDFWNQSMPAGLRWNTNPGSSHGFRTPGFNASGWPETTQQRSLLHCMHAAEWGNHVWEVDHIDLKEKTFRLGRGGWQEARFVSIRENPFYVEGACAALDQEGEWWYDEATSELWLIPNETVSHGVDSIMLDIALPVAPVLMNITGSEKVAIKNVTLQGLTFTHTQRTIMDEYVVPSPGDWSVHPGGVVTATSADSISIVNCTFNRTGGNSVAFIGGVDKSVVSGCEMEMIGDSGVVLIGKLPGLGNDGSNATTPLRYPRDTLITRNHIHDIGIWGKQTSALFQAVTCGTTFSMNVAYNGPRAGVNINDGFCGGHQITANVLFNWVRETQDHGPINTWDRATFKQPHGGLYPEWSRVVSNLIMNGPSGNRDLGNLFPAVDNDDGSAFYWIAQNVVAYGGFKNFLGNDKVWIENIILYPEGRTGDTGNGRCVTAWAGAHEVYQNNTCVTRGSGGPDVDPYPYPSGKECTYADKATRAVLLHLAHNTYFNAQSRFVLNCGMEPETKSSNLSLHQVQMLGVEVGSKVGSVPPTCFLLGMAAALLGMNQDFSRFDCPLPPRFWV